MKTTKYRETIEDIIKEEVKCPLNVSIIPNYMGINLVSVHSIEWEKQDDGQLVNLKINFIPENQLKDVGVNYDRLPKIPRG